MTIFRKLFRPARPAAAAAAPADAGAGAAIARGDAGRDGRDWPRAVAGYREALDIDPEMTGIWVQYGHALKETGEIGAAIDAYRRAADRAPDDAETRLHLAHALKRLGREDEAIAAFREALDIDPSGREAADEIFALRHQAATGGGPSDLDRLVEEVAPGVSVVTSARNRTENLLRALPTWLACPEVDEVVIVDWTSDEPVRAALTAAGLSDPRIRVLRVEGEPRWVLSTAFNAGFRAASRDTILKADADIVLKDGFFARNALEDGVFLAGNWRDAEPGQEFINGFFLIRRADLMKVGGFNEFITTYGWDDDDLYDRLEGAGVRRRGVDPATISHLPHDDAARTGREAGEFADAGEELLSGTAMKISANRIMCALLPGWHAGRRLQPFAIRSRGDDGLITVRRAAPAPHALPDETRRDIERYAILQYLAGRFGEDVFALSHDSFGALMATASVEAVTATALAVAARRPDLLSPTGNYLIVSLDAETREDRLAMIGGLRALDALARPAGFRLVVADLDAEVLAARFGADAPAAFVEQGPAAAFVSAETVRRLGALGAGPGECREFRLTRANAAALLAQTEVPAPVVTKRRDKLFIDAQHGLGNRLRAIGSAAAIAEKADRDLVIVWRPDAHCDCAFTDLFAYYGAVIETSFPDDARDSGMSVYNYMEVEPGADRGAPIVLHPGADAYLRSAYVLESPLSEWADENRFLRSLVPSAAVTELVESVRSPNDVSVHVRMEVRAAADGGSYDAPENWPAEDHEMILKWRAKSHFSNFMARLDEMIAAGEAETIFLAADLPETYAAFTETYGDRLAWLPRAVWDRSREQMLYALADAILLSRSRTMLGSNWSSFSEIALRLSDSFDQVQLSGTDF